MANYNILECLSNTTYIVSAETLTEGTTIGFSIGEDLFCGVVSQITTEPITPYSLYNSTFVDCCECLSAATDTLNFQFETCDSKELINIEATNFCNQFGIPITGKTYEIQYGSQTSFCATFQGMNPTGETNYFYVSGPYAECINCSSDIPRSAGTESTVCVICCPCGSTGSTITQVSPPHPVWTDGYGTSVTQLNMVTLGGNGLNS